MTTAAKRKVAILGINGHIGHFAAIAFAEAGWRVVGFGRTNRRPVQGVAFVMGDADRVEDMRRATDGADVVVNALNLPYDQWGNGAMEAQAARVVAALRPGQTLMFPGNIYNYAASLRQVTPDAAQVPETARGAIRVRVEETFRAAAVEKGFQLVVLRAGDFFAPDLGGDWFDQAILSEAGKGRMALPSRPEIGHSWAYLPDLGRAFVRLAEHRVALGQIENFHFAGHFVTGTELEAAIRKAAPVKLKAGRLPWGLLGLIGLFQPMMREIWRMRYLWQNSMELKDERLEALLGPDFATPFDVAIAGVVAPFFGEARRAA